MNPQWERINADTERLDIGCGYLVRVAGFGVVYIEGDHRLPAGEGEASIVADAVDRLADLLDERLPVKGEAS